LDFWAEFSHCGKRKKKKKLSANITKGFFVGKKEKKVAIF
jgi:hypothetical protein